MKMVLSRVTRYMKRFQGPLAIGIATGLAISILAGAVVFFYSFGILKVLGCVSGALGSLRVLLYCINCILGDSIGIVDRSDQLVKWCKRQFKRFRAVFFSQPACKGNSRRKSRKKRDRNSRKKGPGNTRQCSR